MPIVENIWYTHALTASINIPMRLSCMNMRRTWMPNFGNVAPFLCYYNGKALNMDFFVRINFLTCRYSIELGFMLNIFVVWASCAKFVDRRACAIVVFVWRVMAKAAFGCVLCNRSNGGSYIATNIYVQKYMLAYFFEITFRIFMNIYVIRWCFFKVSHQNFLTDIFLSPCNLSIIQNLVPCLITIQDGAG